MTHIMMTELRTALGEHAPYFFLDCFQSGSLQSQCSHPERLGHSAGGLVKNQ